MPRAAHCFGWCVRSPECGKSFGYCAITEWVETWSATVSAVRLRVAVVDDLLQVLFRRVVQIGCWYASAHRWDMRIRFWRLPFSRSGVARGLGGNRRAPRFRLRPRAELSRPVHDANANGRRSPSNWSQAFVEHLHRNRVPLVVLSELVEEPRPLAAVNGYALAHGLLLTWVSSIPFRDEITGGVGPDNVC